MHPKIDLLAFAAHPDDVEIAVSGIMIKHKMNGLKTGVIDLTAGELGTRGNAELRRIESENASKIMQLDIRENLGLRDGFFEVDEASCILVIQTLRKFRPEIVLINSEVDRHPDHGRAHTLVKRACFLSGLIKVKTELEGKEQKAWRPKSMYSYIQDYYSKPDIVIDVTEFWEKRMESLKCYGSQFYNPESNEDTTPISSIEFLENLVGRSVQFGRFINCRHAEGLISVKPIGVDMITQLS